MEIWVNFEKSKNMGNVDMGKILKTLPIMVCQYMGKYCTYGGEYNGLSKLEPCDYSWYDLL